jgi:hypothetical protein
MISPMASTPAKRTFSPVATRSTTPVTRPAASRDARTTKAAGAATAFVSEPWASLIFDDTVYRADRHRIVTTAVTSA